MTNIMEDAKRWQEFMKILQQATQLLCNAQSDFADDKFINYCHDNASFIHRYLLDCLAIDAAEWQIAQQFDIAQLLDKLPIAINGYPMTLIAKMALIVSFCVHNDGLQDIISINRPNDLRWIVSAMLMHRKDNLSVNACLNHLSNPEIVNALYSLKYGKHDGKEVDLDLFTYAIAFQSPDFAITWLRILSKNESFKPTYNSIRHWVGSCIEVASDYKNFPNPPFCLDGGGFEVFLIWQKTLATNAITL